MLTIKLKIRQPNNGKIIKLNKYITDFTACSNWWLKKIQREKTTSRTKLHQKYYYIARDKFQLPSANIQSSLDKAIETQRSFLKKKGKKSEPEFKSLFGCFRPDSFKIENNAIRLTIGTKQTYDKYLWLPLIIPDKYKNYLNCKFGRSEIKQINKKWYLYLTIEPEIKVNTQFDNVVGVDIGVCKLAVISTPDKKINKFFSGSHIRYIKERYINSRKALQEKLSNANNCYRALKRISNKEQRWMRDVNHKISRAIVNIAKEYNSIIAVENLVGIRERIKATKRVRRMLHRWNFRQLISFIEYKSPLEELHCVSVDPRGTSQRCSFCGHTEKNNRKSQSRFKCSNCGREINADLNSSRNISQRALETMPIGYMPIGRGDLTHPNVGLAYNLNLPMLGISRL